MKATPLNLSESNNISNILRIPKSEQKHYPFFNPDNYANNKQKQNILNMPLKNVFEKKGGLNHNFPNKRNFRDIFISNINENSINNNDFYPTNLNDVRNRNSTNTSFFNQPNLIKKIMKNENMANFNLNNKINDNNIINNNLQNSEENNNNDINQINNDNFNINNNIDINYEEEKNQENLEESRIKFKKKIVDEYNILERILKEEQNLFLNDNFHVEMSREYEKIPEEFSSYIISKRVNFPDNLYNGFSPSLNNNDIPNIAQQNQNNDSSVNYIVIYPPINCIIFVQKEILTFFNYINETSLIYNDFSKPVIKFLITIPKPGVFVNDVKFIMICVLEGEIQLLTLAYPNKDDDLPIIHKTDFTFIFKEKVIDLVSTSNYRIFISASYNKIYELDYYIKQYSFNIFGPRNTLEAIRQEPSIFTDLLADLTYIFKTNIQIIHKLKVDNTRNLLYALKYSIPKNEKNFELDKAIDSSIIIFDLGIDGKDFIKIAEISQEDLMDYGFELYGYNNYLYNQDDINNNNLLIQKSNFIVDITPLTRDKYKEYHLLIIKRNGNKLFIKFDTYIDDTNIKNQDEILKFNNSAFYRRRIINNYKLSLKQMSLTEYNRYNYNNNDFYYNNFSIRKKNILYDIINYFPFTTFCYYKDKNEKDKNLDEYILKVIDDDFSEIAKNENLLYFNPNNGIKEKEEIIFRSNSNNKKVYSIIKLSNYNIEDTCGLGNLLKNSNELYLTNNINYLDSNSSETISYNCMNEYSKQMFYAPEEYAILFSDEFIILKKLRPIDLLIEIIQCNNLNNNLLNAKNNLNIRNGRVNNFDNDVNSNLRGNERINNIRRRLNMETFIDNKDEFNNPFQINRDKLISQNFREFLDMHGYIETIVMLLNIITNDNLYYYIKNKIDDQNNINKLTYNNKIINNINKSDNNTNNENINNNANENINNNENNLYLERDYLNPYSLIKLKNDNILMKMGQDFIIKIFKFAKEDIDIQIFQYQYLIENLINTLKINKDLLNHDNNNNFRFKFNNDLNNNKHVLNDIFEGRNFMSYGFILFISRIVRLFWEEYIFVRNKLYYQEDNFEFNIINNLNQIQIMFIKNMLIKFIHTINQYKIDLLQNASDITTKSNKFKNYLKDVDQFINNNSEFEINEIKKKLNKEEQDILIDHKKTLKYYMSVFNFEKFSEELEEIINITKRIIEILNFIDAIYRINITNELKKRKSYNILNIKVKDIFKGNYPFIINELLQIIYEFYLNENSMEFASIKMQEIIQECPNIINKSDANAIEGNFILKFCNYNEMNNIDKIKYVKEAIEKINLNLLSINIEEVVNYLSKFHDIKNIIHFCLKKGKLLEPEINKNIDQEPNKQISLYNQDITLFDIYNKEKEVNINEVQTENNITEFYKCITIILNILQYLNKSMIYNSFEKFVRINSPNENFFEYPIYILNLLSNKQPNDYKNMENTILNMVFDKKYEYIHYNIIEFLKENKILNKLQTINSESIEKYLNNQVNINNTPQSLYSMFDFYFKNKNYSCATKILASLINYKNSAVNIHEIQALNGSEIKNKSYVSLDDRITYVNTMLRTIELQMKNAEYIQLPEQKMKEIQEAKELKEKMINIRNILNIQYEIKSYLIIYINNAINNNPNNLNNINNLDGFQTAIIKLDNEIICLNDLYKDYAKKFFIFDSCISILFENKFANSDNKIDTKEVRSVYCDYFCKFDKITLEEKWPFINFDRFNRIFNILINEKTQYQNFYNMLQNNGMKNKYRDIIPLEFIIAIIESINRKIIFLDNLNDDNNYYLNKLKQNFRQPKNPFWFIQYLNEQILLPFSYIFNEYYIIYLSLSKNPLPKKLGNNNINDLISNRSMTSNNDNSSIHTFNSNNLSVINNNSYEEYGMIFDGNLTGDINKKKSQDSKFYSLFLLLGVAKLWVNRLMDINKNKYDNYLEPKINSQDELDFKQFNLEIIKNDNMKIKNLIKEYFEELNNCRLTYSEQKYKSLKNYGEIIENEIKNSEDIIRDSYDKIKKKKYEKKEDNDDFNNRSTDDNLLRINFIGDNKNNFMPFTNSRISGGFINLLKK